jgi:ornithine cyclodeaminase/alanine dehydrogenase-like protein (mu-crystallin family)
VETWILSWENIIDLPDFVAGNSPRRKHRDDITVFKNNGGTGLQFAAVGPAIYEPARAAGIGRKLTTGWFMGSMKP